ncbi:MAG TPA: ribosome biogenesis factor YjgA [Usitatibacter sp.]|nr:ribosome biogenesis factor YjgA [Usitatibacter sp.]
MDDDEFISKTKRKRQMTELQDVGAALVRLSPEQLARLELPEALREAVLECKRLKKHEAVRRQKQYIGRIMRDIDAEPIVEQLRAIEAPSRQQTALLHLAEKWRDEMLHNADAVDRFAREFPHADAHKLRALVAAANEERRGKRAPKHFRELFHMLNTIIQEQARHP